MSLHEPRREHFEIATTISSDSALGNFFRMTRLVDKPAEVGQDSNRAAEPTGGIGKLEGLNFTLGLAVALETMTW